MKTISISDWAHQLLTEEIEEDKNTEAANRKTFGTIVDDVCKKRYRKKLTEEKTND